MAMDQTILGNALADLTDLSALSSSQREEVREHWRKIAGVIIDHIQQYAEVTIAIDDGQAASVTGVVPGTVLANTAGPVSGTLVSPGPSNANDQWTGQGTIE